jgi:hypothetical protein
MPDRFLCRVSDSHALSARRCLIAWSEGRPTCSRGPPSTIINWQPVTNVPVSGKPFERLAHVAVPSSQLTNFER